MKRRGLVMKVADREQFPALDRLGRFADQHAVHDDFTLQPRDLAMANLCFAGMLETNAYASRLVLHRLTLLQIGERDQDVVAWVELQDLFLHC